MRHIQIKILAIIVALLISVSSYGQMQQVLKNGFVAATDSGLYYLQDGFNEWLNLGTINANIYDNRFIRNVDTITGVTFYEKELVCVGAGLSNGSNGEDLNMWINYYSHHITDTVYVNLAGSTETYNRKNINNKFKSGMVVFGVLESAGNNACNITCFNTDGNRNGYYFLDNGDYDVSRTRLATDNDTIFVVASHNNILVKCKNTVISTGNSNTEFTDNINISGLHSRPTDSHQICYNADDDEFIIVSDSGIVYSYDKTTLTTLDTLDYSYRNSPLDRIKSLEYNNGQIMVIAISTDGKEDFAVHSLSNLTANDLYASAYVSYQILDISRNKNQFILFNFTPNETDYNIISIIKLDGTDEEYIKPTSYMADKTVFDLDYINYMP